MSMNRTAGENVVYVCHSRSMDRPAARLEKALMAHPAGRFDEPFTTAFGEYLDHLQAMLEIRDWRIALLATYPSDSEAGASIKCIYGRRVAELELAKDFFGYTAELQQHYIIHELAHVMVEGCDNVIENGLDVILGKPAHTVLRETWSVQVEYLVDQLAYVLAYLLTGGPEHDRLWNKVLRAERGEPPIAAAK